MEATRKDKVTCTECDNTVNTSYKQYIGSMKRPFPLDGRNTSVNKRVGNSTTMVLQANISHHIRDVYLGMCLVKMESPILMY